MAETYKVLAQIESISDTAVSMYTVPADTSITTSHVSILNSGVASTSYSLYAVPSSEYQPLIAPESKHAIIKSKTIDTGEHHEITGGITLSEGDALLFEAENDYLVINVYGVEIS
jgi:hypothetical protein